MRNKSVFIDEEDTDSLGRQSTRLSVGFWLVLLFGELLQSSGFGQ